VVGEVRRHQIQLLMLITLVGGGNFSREFGVKGSFPNLANCPKNKRKGVKFPNFEELVGRGYACHIPHLLQYQCEKNYFNVSRLSWDYNGLTSN